VQERMAQCTFEKATALTADANRPKRKSAWSTDWLRSRKIRERCDFSVSTYTYVILKYCLCSVTFWALSGCAG
jgi:hypothetical protein